MATKTFRDFIKAESTITNKNTAINNFIMNTLDKLQSMFIYENLPESIPQKWLEFYLMVNGNVFITNKPTAKTSGNLYAFTGGCGGVPDAYYQPTIYTVSNPYLNITEQYKIDADGILIRNDTLMSGMLPLIKKYGSMLVESDITIRCALINLRIFNTISANDDNTKKSADEYLNQIENGKIGVIGGSPFFDGVEVHNNTNITGYLTQLIEITQYIKASFYNELGLNANYNLKREYISNSENTLADDVLLPFCDDMLAERKKGIEKVNEMFGTDIKVEFNSSWKANNSENAKQIAENENIIGGESDESENSGNVAESADVKKINESDESESEKKIDGSGKQSDGPDAESSDEPDAESSDEPDAESSDEPDESDNKESKTDKKNV